ncbi:unnamed protein product [Sympodiomycopsis kandeliae]
MPPARKPSEQVARIHPRSPSPASRSRVSVPSTSQSSASGVATARSDAEQDKKTGKQREALATQDNDSDEPDLCLICLRSDIQDRSILPNCLHSLFCFECILQWSEQKRTCPLCNRPLGEYLLHNVRNDADYSRHFLRPEYEIQKEKQDAGIANVANTSIQAERARAVRRQLRDRHTSRLPPIRPRDGERSGWTEWARSVNGTPGSEDATNTALAEMDRAIERRRLVYRHGLYAQHMGSNRHSGFRAPPSPQKFTTEPHHLVQLIPFLRRELYSLPLLTQEMDTEFLIDYIVSILKTMPIRSEGAVRLLTEFFGRRELAEHFTHEIMTFCRSGARDCRGFDKRAVYGWPWLRVGRSRNAGDSRRATGSTGGSARPNRRERGSTGAGARLDRSERGPNRREGGSTDDRARPNTRTSLSPERLAPSDLRSFKDTRDRSSRPANPSLLDRLGPSSNASPSLLSRISGGGDYHGGDFESI